MLLNGIQQCKFFRGDKKWRILGPMYKNENKNSRLSSGNKHCGPIKNGRGEEAKPTMKDKKTKVCNMTASLFKYLVRKVWLLDGIYKNEEKGDRGVCIAYKSEIMEKWKLLMLLKKEQI
jgi:hypothetical protein